MGCTVTRFEETLHQLDAAAPGAPLLALGQTVLWDEPMKAGIALALSQLGSTRAFVAGVHDTDYFAKLPSGKRQPGRFRAMPHNDTSTRGLWSAAGEFSALFGSETVISRHELTAAGLKLDRIARSRPGVLDEATEAYGWRGVVSLDDDPPVVADMPIGSLYNELESTLLWAAGETAACLTGPERALAERQIEEMRTRMCDLLDDPNESLSSYYRRLLPEFYALAAGGPVRMETTVTTELLRFNTRTCSSPRFDLVRHFLNPGTREAAETAYNDAIRGTEIYTLDRFGTGALPFDLYIPGKGRGTLRVGRFGAVIGSRKPLFLTLRKGVNSLEELAAAVEAKFGPDCVLIGKAVTLIGQLAREFVFVFHEGASSYVKYSRGFHQNLAAHGLELQLHPILRVRYSPWDALASACVWLKLPEPLVKPFGAEELCGPSFASRWREVGREQEERLAKLPELRSATDLIRYLETHFGGQWQTQAAEYQTLHDRLMQFTERVEAERATRRELYERLRDLRSRRNALEHEKGRQFRAEIFEREPTPAAQARRAETAHQIIEVGHQILALEDQIAESLHRQREIVTGEEIQQIHERRRTIELEAELKRLRVIRHAIIASRGLRRAGLRPSAWWFPLLSPDGSWFRRTVAEAECYLEAL